MRPRTLRPLLALATIALASPSLARAEETAPATDASAPAAPVTPTPFPKGGDFGAYLVERYAALELPAIDRGKSGFATGSGLEARYMMPVGWGAYFRYARVAQVNVDCGKDCFVWDEWDVTAGFSRRLQATPQRAIFREQTRLDLGFAYGQAGTNLSCDHGLLPWSVACQSGSAASGHALNASGSAIGVEARLALEIGIGPIGLGIDLGGQAFKSLTHGSNSVALPSVFYAWSAQARAGVSWTIE